MRKRDVDRLKVGMRVRLKRRLVVEDDYCGITLATGMLFDGVREIQKISGYSNDVVIADDDGYGWWYSTHMLVRV